MKRFSIFIVFQFLFWGFAYSQQNIEYIVPDSAYKIINNYLDQHFDSERNICFAFITKKEDSVAINIYIENDNSDNAYKTLSMLSNRIIKINNYKIPILFKEDILYSATANIYDKSSSSYSCASNIFGGGYVIKYVGNVFNGRIFFSGIIP